MRSDQKPTRDDHGQGMPLGAGAKQYRRWKLEDAKARFSEVVRRAQSEGRSASPYAAGMPWW